MSSDACYSLVTNYNSEQEVSILESGNITKINHKLITVVTITPLIHCPKKTDV